MKSKSTKRTRNPSTAKWDADHMARVLAQQLVEGRPSEPEEDGFFWRLLVTQGRTFVLETSHGNFQVTVTSTPQTLQKPLIPWEEA